MRPTALLPIAALALVAACSSTSKKDQPTAATTGTTTVPEKATIGLRAPDFTLADLDGNETSLSDYRGKSVVLEWFNPGCPYVKYAYSEGPLKTMAGEVTGDSVVWLSINSGAPGEQGADPDMNRKAREDWKMASHVLLDPRGDVGRRYGAKTTPHCFVIDRNGVLLYSGALDNAAFGKVVGGAYVNYVREALSDLTEGRPVVIEETDPYGCSVKYGKR